MELNSGLLALFSGFLAQTAKVFVEAVAHRRWQPGLLFANGGMPSSHAATVTTLTLPLARRVRSRQRVELDDGREAGLFPVRVRAADEPVSEVRCDTPLLLARACYHLGNRHVSLQVLPGCLRFPRDHVLEEMLEGLGLSVRAVDDAFHPEAGAYAVHSHG